VANIASARKRARQAEKRRTQRAGQKSMARTKMKNVLKAIGTGDRAAAEAALKDAQPAIDSAVSKKLIHKNAAARYKSRLARRVKAL
jgi:small subunit ribosomal protein S20